MRLSRDMILAINTYFAFKMKGGNGMWQDVETKEKMCKLVDKTAARFGLGCVIAPGLIVLENSQGKTVSITGPIYPTSLG